MLRVALADDASHAVALHNFAVLTDRLHACANFHRRSNSCRTEEVRGQTRTVTEAVTSSKGPGWRQFAPDVASPYASAARTESIAARRSAAAVTIRPMTTYARQPRPLPSASPPAPDPASRPPARERPGTRTASRSPNRLRTLRGLAPAAHDPVRARLGGELGQPHHLRRRRRADRCAPTRSADLGRRRATSAPSPPARRTSRPPPATAASSIAAPPAACTVTSRAPSAAAFRTPPATVFGMSWNLRSRNTSQSRARISRTIAGPAAVNSSFPTL